MSISRRQFLIKTGWLAAGITVVSTSGCSVLPPLPTFSSPDEEDLFTWVQLLPNGRFRYYLSRSEMGQGISTGFTQVVAEELNVPMYQIECHYQSTEVIAPCRMTVGSQSVEDYFELTARAAASLRETLRSKAAQKYKLEQNSIALDTAGFQLPGGERVLYSDLIDKESAIVRPVLDQPSLELFSQRPANQLNIVGKKTEAVHSRRLVTGEEKYSRDVILEDMLFGAIARTPIVGADIISYDREAALATPGVRYVVQHEKQLGVVAATPTATKKGLVALNVQWESFDDQKIKQIDTQLDIDAYIQNGKLDHDSSETQSDNALAGQDSVKQLSYRYDSPMVAHAAMEPRSGVASWDKYRGSCVVWTGCQDPWLVQSAVAKATGISKEKVAVHNLRAGGAFGGRVLCQASVEAAWLSKAAGSPVKVQWSREEEFSHNYVGPQYSTRISATLNSAGQIALWRHQTVSSPILTSSALIPPYLHWLADFIPDPGTKRGMSIPYQVGEHKLEFADERLPMPTGPWRGLGAAPNTFAVESAMDELAFEAQKDPIQFRLDHLPENRLFRCLKRLQDRLGEQHQQYGIAAAAYKDVTFVAIAAKVSTEQSRIRVTELICYHDCGKMISPDQVRAQVEGNLVWGVGMALSEAFLIKDGRISTNNFDSYNIPKQTSIPTMEIQLINSVDAPSGAGEAAIAPVAAAIANAVYVATGERIRRLPIV